MFFPVHIKIIDIYLLPNVPFAVSAFEENITVSKVSRYGVSSDPYFPVFGLNTEICSLICKSPYSVQIWENTDQKKLRIRKLFTQCLISLLHLIYSRFTFAFSIVHGNSTVVFSNLTRNY